MLRKFSVTVMNLFYTFLFQSYNNFKGRISHVVKGKSYRQSVSWIAAILNRKRYQICFFSHFMIYTNFLILSFLYTTYFRNGNRLWQLIPSSVFHPTKLPFIHTLCMYFLRAFQYHVVHSTL